MFRRLVFLVFVCINISACHVSSITHCIVVSMGNCIAFDAHTSAYDHHYLKNHVECNLTSVDGPVDYWCSEDKNTARTVQKHAQHRIRLRAGKNDVPLFYLHSLIQLVALSLSFENLPADTVVTITKSAPYTGEDDIDRIKNKIAHLKDRLI